MRAYNIKIRSHYKITDLLKDLPFYSQKINNIKEKKKSFINNRFLAELSFFPKKVKNLTNYQLSRELPFFLKRSKRSKSLTKHQILKNILPLYDSAWISK